MESQGTLRQWDPLRVLFAGAACFALISVGFFLAVLLSAAPGFKNGPGTLQSLTSAQKTQVVNELSPNTTSSTTGATTSNGTSAASSAGQASSVTPQQADANDKNAAAKLNVLGNLNSQ